MPQKKHKPEEIVAKLRQVDVLVSQGQSVAEAVRSISVTQFTYYRWRKEFGGLKTEQVKRLCGHHLSADASRRSAWPRTGGGSCLALPVGDHGLAHPHGPGVADLEHRAMVRHWSEDHGEGTPTSASRR
jgi:hypothetical protein